MSHEGPVVVRFSGDRVTVLCPLGHVVTGRQLGPDFAGSWLEARIAQHQADGSWTATCEGADPRDALARAGAGSAAYLNAEGTDFESLEDFLTRPFVEHDRRADEWSVSAGDTSDPGGSS